MKQTFAETLWAMQSDGVSLTNTLTETSLLNNQDKLTLPAGYFDAPGKAIRIRGMGRLSNLVTTPGTLTLKLYFGATNVFNGGAMQLSSTAHTTLPFWFDIQLVCRAIGASSNLMGQGFIKGQPLSLTAVADSTTTIADLMIPNVTPVVGTNFDSSVLQQVDLKGAFSVANAANLVQLHQFYIEALN